MPGLVKLRVRKGPVVVRGSPVIQSGRVLSGFVFFGEGGRDVSLESFGDDLNFLRDGENNVLWRVLRKIVTHKNREGEV